MKRKALGKGLSALLPDPDPSPAGEEATLHVSPDRLDVNPFQPRTLMEPSRLQELAASIRESGMIQPLLVRRAGGRYQIIAGERRWRAAQMLGLAAGPVGAGGGAPGGPAARPAPAPQRPPRPEHARGRGALARGPGDAGPDRPPGEVGHAPRGVRDGSGAAADLRAAASGRARKVGGMLTFLPATRGGSAGSPDSLRAWGSGGA